VTALSDHDHTTRSFSATTVAHRVGTGARSTRIGGGTGAMGGERITWRVDRELGLGCGGFAPTPVVQPNLVVSRKRTSRRECVSTIMGMNRRTFRNRLRDTDQRVGGARRSEPTSGPRYGSRRTRGCQSCCYDYAGFQNYWPSFSTRPDRVAQRILAFSC
jgi:hypothetical protein